MANNADGCDTPESVQSDEAFRPAREHHVSIMDRAVAIMMFDVSVSQDCERDCARYSDIPCRLTLPTIFTTFLCIGHCRQADERPDDTFCRRPDDTPVGLG